MTSHLEEKYQASWQERQTFAENMQPIIGQLFRNKGIEILVYGRPLLNASSIDIIKAHKSVALHEENKLRFGIYGGDLAAQCQAAHSGHLHVQEIDIVPFVSGLLERLSRGEDVVRVQSPQT